MGGLSAPQYFLTCQIADAHVLSLHMPVCITGDATARGLEKLMDTGAIVMFAPDVTPRVIDAIGDHDNLFAALTHVPVEHPKAIRLWRPLVDASSTFVDALVGDARLGIDFADVHTSVIRRLLATAVGRAHDAGKWVHVHGLPFNEWSCSYGVSSIDSDSWRDGARWKGVNEHIAGVAFSRAEHLTDPLDESETLTVCAVAARAHVENWRQMVNAL